MTYQTKTGFFIVGITTGSQSVGGGTGTITLDKFYSSSGEISSSSVSGLAISETRCDSISGLSPYFSQSPTSSGGYGGDLPPALGSRGSGATLGCGVINSSTLEIHFSNYDIDRVLLDSYCAVFGGKS
tara:strand:- start:69 stop:452 length:384 start_codon:yes stop_codon:yes gene_type:complete